MYVVLLHSTVNPCFPTAGSWQGEGSAKRYGPKFRQIHGLLETTQGYVLELESQPHQEAPPRSKASRNAQRASTTGNNQVAPEEGKSLKSKV